MEFFTPKKEKRPCVPYATVEEWKDKTAEVTTLKPRLGEAGRMLLETLIDDLFASNRFDQLKSRWEKEAADEAGAGQSIVRHRGNYGMTD